MIETIVCEHTETVEKVPGLDLQVAECSLCGQTRKFKDSDKESIIITKLGRIGKAIVMPEPGQKLELIPEESCLVRAGWGLPPKSPPTYGRRRRTAEQLPRIKPLPAQPLVEEPVAEPALAPEAPLPQPKVRESHKGKYDKHQEEILADYGRMSVSDLAEKHGIPRPHFYYLKRKWEAKGVVFPPPFHSKLGVRRRAAKPGRPRTGKWMKCPDCGKDIYVRKFTLDRNPEAEHRCRSCASKHARKAPRRTIKVPTVTAEPGLKEAFREMVKEGIDIPYDVAMDMLIRYLQREPAATIKAVIDDDEPFTAMQLQEKLFGLYIEVIIEESDKFEEVGKGVYKLKS